PAHISLANFHEFIPVEQKPNWWDTHRTPPTVSIISMDHHVYNGVPERTSRSVTHPKIAPTRAHLLPNSLHSSRLWDLTGT
ncbi:hypothetical protein ACLOJK_034143, partial [Asimina triloba]